MVRAVAAELDVRLVGARVEKVLQPSKDEIFLALHRESEHFRLGINAGAQSPRIGLTAEAPENPKVPPMFCMLLRKHLTGARIESVRQIDFERVIEIEFETYDEMGYFTKRRLITEIMGRYSNTVLCDENYKILSALRPVDFSTSRKRQLLPQMTYEMPPSQDKTDPFAETEEGFFGAFADRDTLTEKDIMSRYTGFSPISARELIKSASGGAYADKSTVFEAFKGLLDRTRKCKFTPTMIFAPDGRAVDIYCFELTRNGENVTHRCFETFGELTDGFYAENERREREKSRAHSTERVLRNAENRLVKKLELQRKELKDTEKKSEYKQKADLITANIYRFNGKAEKITVIDYVENADGGYDEVEVELTLERGLTPVAYSQKLYKKYAKARNAETEIAAQIEKGEGELRYVRSVLDALSRCSGQNELDEIRAELTETGYIKSAAKEQKKGKKPPEKRQLKSPLKTLTSGGFTVLTGKNNLQNDYLTFKLASKSDYWFHVKGIPGSHTVLFCEGREPSAQDLTEAAQTAAKNSKAAGQDRVEVDYTRIKNVRKPAGARPGFVIYEGYSTAIVSGEERKEIQP